MLTPQIVVKGLKQLKKTKSDFCIAVTEFEAPVERRLYFVKHKKKNQIFLKEKVLIEEVKTWKNFIMMQVNLLGQTFFIYKF